MQMALAKQLSQRISESDKQRNWGKVKSSSKKKAVGSKFDSLSPEHQERVNAATAAQMIAETLEENQGKEPPIEASREFAGVLERIAQVDANFGLVAPVIAQDHYEEADLEMGPEHKTDEEYESDENSGDCQGLDCEQDEPDSGLVCDESWPCVVPSDLPTSPEEPPTLHVISDNEPDDDEDNFNIPELTPEIMMKMLANMEVNGM
ncbi:MAG: hypothetical protein ACLP7Q_26775, partial [Isosphaeraceae bacterium]